MKTEALVILSPGFPENESDSTCIPPQQVFVKALQQLNPQLQVIVLTLQYPFHSGNYKWHAVEVFSYGSKRTGRLYRATTGFKVSRTLTRLNRNYRLVGLFSFWFGKCALISHRFAKRHGLKHYSWILGQDAKPGNKYFNLIKPDAGSLIALSDFIAAEFDRNYGVKPRHLIPVGIDTALFGAQPVEKDIDILGAGSLIPLKNYRVLLEMTALLKKTLPAIKVVLCGDGPEMPLLKAMALKMGIENNLQFAGRQTHPEVLQLMQRSKILLHPSTYEGFGAVCLEALYAGAHVVSFVKPMDRPIKNWYHAPDKTAMFYSLKEKLHDDKLTPEKVLPFTIGANVKAMMTLFYHKDESV